MHLTCQLNALLNCVKSERVFLRYFYTSKCSIPTILGIFKHKFLSDTFKFWYIVRWFTLDWSVYFKWYAFY